MRISTIHGANGLLTVAIAVLIAVGGCAHERPAVEPDTWHPTVHRMLIEVGDTECVTPDSVIHAHPQDILVFVARDQNTKVSRLARGPVSGGPGIGAPLTDGSDTKKVPRGGNRSVIISNDALGTYELKLACGPFEDDPPRIIVDR